MTEINTYKCDFCGQVFDDEEECHIHEWECRYKELCLNENCKHLRLWTIDGNEIKNFGNFSCGVIGAIEVHSYQQAQFINDYFEEFWCQLPIRIKDGIVKHYGLWYYDPDYGYGDWRSYEEVLGNIQEIGKKFNQGA